MFKKTRPISNTSATPPFPFSSTNKAYNAKMEQIFPVVTNKAYPTKLMVKHNTE